jgi:phosphatidylinositol glycan class C protein
MFATSILASRLTDPSAVFADVLLATTLFVLFPFASRFLSKRFFKVHVVGVGVSHACAVSAMYHMTVGSVPLITAYSLLILFITFLCPITLTNLMRFKKQINGPWDEADVRGTNVSLSTGKGTGGRKIVMAGNGHGVGF